MSIDGIRTELDRIPGFWPNLNHSFDFIGFDERFIQQFCSVDKLRPPKYFKDSVWGMMEFSPEEVALINSPLIQRLRRVYQLGFTYLTYPSAEHSRFSHTLGVTHVVKRLIASIATSTQKQNCLVTNGDEYPFYDPNKDSERSLVQSLIHAAIMHDCGHLAFSHAGESAFSYSYDVSTVGGCPTEDFLYIFRGAEFDSDLSECLSIAICLSPRFRAFYSKIIGSNDIDKRIDELCSFIGGKTHNPAYPGLANIISGAAVDADKIDYLNRDARECGIPVGVDISRVFLNTSMIKIEDHQVAKLASANGGTGHHGFLPGWQFIVNSTGLDTYDELANAKSILYNRVYLHQLTRNAERVLANIVRSNCSASTEFSDVLYWYRFGDEEFLAKNAEVPSQRLAVRRLALRDLPKRAFTIYRDACKTFVTMHDLFDRTSWSSVEDYLDKINDDFVRQSAWKLYDRLLPSGRLEKQATNRHLTQEIKDEAFRLRKLVDHKFEPTDANEPFVGFSPRHVSKPVPEVLVREKNAIGFSWNWSKSEELTTAEHVSKGTDYFYCDDGWREFVAVVAAKVLFNFNAEKHGTWLKDEGDSKRNEAASNIKLLPRLVIDMKQIANRIGFDYQKLLALMHAAANKGFFQGLERIVPLQNPQQDKCKEIASKYSKFEGERGWRISERLGSRLIKSTRRERRSSRLMRDSCAPACRIGLRCA